MMFDVTERESYRSIPEWYKKLITICECIPIVLVGNKVDDKNKRVKARQINFQISKNIQYYDLSAKANYQY